MAEEKKGVTIRLPRNPWIFSTLILLVILLIFLVGGWGTTGMVTEVLTAEQASNTAIDYINNYLLQGQGVATLESVEEDGDLYNVKLKISGNLYDSYVTKDGELFFPSAIDLTEAPETPTQETQETPEAPKSDRPEAHAFVMSYCPYGLQFIKAYVPVIELLGDKADLELNFVHYIMHEEKEATENTRMYCIQKEQNDKFADYLRCFVEDGEAEKCISDVGVDETQLETCMQETDEEFEITKNLEESEERFPPYNVDAELCEEYGVQGSPTFVLNGQIISVTRSADAIKEAVCSAFNNPPEECEQELSTTSEQPSFGAMGAGGGSAPSGGQC